MAAPFDIGSASDITAAVLAHVLANDDTQVLTDDEKAVVEYLIATAETDLDVIRTKVGYLTITGAVDADAVAARVGDLATAMIVQGAWDASAGTFPGGGTAQTGECWFVSVAGTVDGVSFQTEDMIVARANDASTSSYASEWHKIDSSDRVLSVAGEVGAISAGDLQTALSLPADTVTALAAKADTSALGTAAEEDVGDFASAAQGTLAGSAMQPTTRTTESGATVNLAPSHANGQGAGAVTVTHATPVLNVQAQSAATYVANTELLLKSHTGTATITAASGVSINGSAASSWTLPIRPSSAVLLRDAEDSWSLVGNVTEV